MSASRQATMKDLAEEAKKRIVYLAICTVGLSYLMSLTSSSVWVNLPAAATLIIALRYFALDLEMRRKAAVYNSKKPAVTTASQKKPIQGPRVVERTNWRRKVDSPIVEVAMDRFTRHLVSEWVTDLWYSRLTPDREGPEELVHIINDVLAEFSDRVRNINLIDLLTRDIVCLICTHLEIFRMSQAKIYKQRSEQLTSQQLDSELRRILALENKLHPALFSTDAEHKVLQHVMDGLISFAFKPEDLQCSFFRYIVRELLACAVMRPVLNLANPRFINERIEAFVISKTTANKGAVAAQEASPSKNGTTRVSSDHFSKFLDPTATGVELVQLKTNLSKTTSDARTAGDTNGKYLSKDPLLSMDARSTRSWNSFPADSQNGVHTENLRHRSGGEWGEMLDVISRRKAQALAPEHFENMWTKGRNYRKKEGENRLIEQVPQRTPASKAVTADHCNTVPKSKGKNEIIDNNNPGGSTSLVRNSCIQPKQTFLGHSLTSVAEEDDEHGPMRLEETDFGSSSDTCEDEESGTVTGLDSPGTKVWDGKSKRNLAVAPIHHPLESFEGTSVRKNSKGHSRYQRIRCAPSGRKRSRLSNTKVHVWQEVERTSFLSGDGQDILSTPKGYGDDEDSSGGDSDNEVLGRANSWEGASSSAPSMSLPENRGSSINKVQNSLRVDSFLKLRCEVLGANIVKSGSKTFAVYSISVTDVNNNSWSIKRRFRHFEELHRRLKEFPEYNLHLPPKHFLSTGLDISVIQERCKLLDRYLKNLMQLPTVSGSIEVWDFLSVDSQTYYFLNSFSIVETLSVDLEDKPAQKSKKVLTFSEPTGSPSSSRKEKTVWDNKETALQMKHDPPVDYSTLHAQEQSVNSRENDTAEQTSDALLDATTDPTLPSEWVPPNLSMPLLDLVDVIFQLQDGGWIRRKVFWVAKQILQLGMGDAFDDWLIEKIQLLRKGSVIASGINRLEQILWPDGIFITKHPKRRRAPPPSNISQSSPQSPQPSEISPPRQLDEQQQLEAERRAKFVYEIMIDRAPAAIVGIVGRKEYEQCAKDLYFFLQSAVCLKLLAFDLLELLLLSAFPELDFVFKQLYEEKHKFGEYRES